MRLPLEAAGTAVGAGVSCIRDTVLWSSGLVFEILGEGGGFLYSRCPSRAPRGVRRWFYRGISLIRRRHPGGPYSSPTLGSEVGAVSLKRGIPVVGMTESGGLRMGSRQCVGCSECLAVGVSQNV